VDQERVIEAVHEIATLEPKPGRRFASVETRYVVPDVLVKKVGDDYAIILNEDGMPRLRVNPYYRNVIGQGDEARRYVEDRMRSAIWLIKSIHQRQKTLYKVTNSIVQFQKAFLDKGLPHLRPLSLRDVAEDIRMHESTVSRVTTSKFVETPQGVLPLKFFFHSGIAKTQGDEVSSSASRRLGIEDLGGEGRDREAAVEQDITRGRSAGGDLTDRAAGRSRSTSEELGILPSHQRPPRGAQAATEQGMVLHLAGRGGVTISLSSRRRIAGEDRQDGRASPKLIEPGLVLATERHRHLSEVTLHARGATLHARARPRTSTRPIDLALGHAVRQIRRKKERVSSRKGRSARPAGSRHRGRSRRSPPTRRRRRGGPPDQRQADVARESGGPAASSDRRPAGVPERPHRRRQRAPTAPGRNGGACRARRLERPRRAGGEASGRAHHHHGSVRRGKSWAIKCFEDMGYYCVDNLPTTLIPTFAELCAHSTRRIGASRSASTSGEREYLHSVVEVLGELREAGYRTEVLFLEASEEALVRRYHETRRRLPVSSGSVPGRDPRGAETPRQPAGASRSGDRHVPDHGPRAPAAPGSTLYGEAAQPG
jgi:ribosome-associated translation inhibitor RaiA